MHFPILPIHLPTEPFAIWQGGFSTDELRMIVDLGELREFEAGRVGGNPHDNGEVNAGIRETDVAWIDHREDTDWLYRRMGALAAQINHDKFRYKLDGFQTLQYGRYQTNGHYDWHLDSGPNMPVHRKLSFVLALNDPEEYEGGELLLNVTGNPDHAHTMRIQKGDLVVFPAHTPHKVNPVTSGTRMTLVGWATGPAFQ